MKANRLVIRNLLLCGITSLALSSWSGVSTSVENADRPEADIARDAGRKPGQVVQFLGLEEGAVAIDLMALGGYYTEVLSHAVGTQGTVYAQNAPMMLEFRDGYYGKLLAERLGQNRLANVIRIDIYNGAGEEAALHFLSNVAVLLKAGGVLGIIDHAGNTGVDNNSLHRMEESVISGLIGKSEFRLDGASDILRSAADDRSGGVFSADIRGKTDRFLLRLKKRS